MIETAKAERFVAIPFLLIAGMASIFMSFFGLFAAGWGGAWTGSSTGERILHLLFWLLPSLSIFAFGTFFKWKRVGLLGSWAISVGSMITIFIVNMESCLIAQCTTTNPVKIAVAVFLLPHIWILLAASFGLQLAFFVRNDSTISSEAKTSKAGD